MSKALDRREVVARLVRSRGDLLIVAGLGSPAYDLMAAGDHEANFYLWGGMGSAATIALGLALAQPKRPVLALTGDGEMLMGLGALATIGRAKPKNLSIAVLDNGRYGETGMQESHTASGTRLDQVAMACGFAWAMRIESEAALAVFAMRLPKPAGPALANIVIRAENPPRVLPPRDGVFLKNRFRASLGFKPI